MPIPTIRAQISRRLARSIVLPMLLAAGCGGGLAAPAATSVDFNRDVRRVLAENCFSCHGPDAKVKSTEFKPLRLDLSESARSERRGRRAIVPGKPDESELIRRICSGDAGEKMPPPESGKQLTPEAIQVDRKSVV